MRVRHSRIHNALSGALHQGRLTEDELLIELKSHFRKIVEDKDAKSALEIANNLTLENLEKAHPKIEMVGVGKAHSELVARLEFTHVPKVDFSSSLTVGGIGFTLIPISFYEPTETNKKAALQFVNALAEALR